ncbi:hypothetical protein LA6_001421 [Marinibacterium anthonyi]|nr:hypothetical protein LA6_001421 [Marinibacterium anthonyi]
MKQVTLTASVPLLASWGWDDRVITPSTHPQRRRVDLMMLQSRRWQTASAIERDFQELLQFVSPSCQNFPCHSPRISALLVRTCMEVESCFKSILSENDVSKKRQKSIEDFRVVEKSHSLSRYSVKIHGWHQGSKVFRPFQAWGAERSCDPPLGKLVWYSAYGSLKHNVLDEVEYGTFENLCCSICGLHALLVSQFGFTGWGPQGVLGFYSAPEYECAVGSTVEVRFPRPEECNVVYDLPKTWSYPIESFEYN